MTVFETMLLGAIPSFMPQLTGKQIPALYWSSHAALFQRIPPARHHHRRGARRTPAQEYIAAAYAPRSLHYL